MRGGDDDLVSAVFEECSGRLADGSGGVDHVVHQQAGTPGDITDDLVHLHQVGDRRVVALVDDRQRRTQPVTPGIGQPDAPGVRANDGHLGTVVFALDIIGQHRQRGQMIERAVEEPLNLRGVQIHAHDAVGAGRPVQIGDQPRRDRLAAQVLLVLPCVRVTGSDHGDSFRGRPLQRVHHDQLLHEPLIDRSRVRLDDEGVRAAHRFLVAHVDLGVGVGDQPAGRQFDAHDLGHGLGELRIGSPGEEHQVFVRRALNTAH